jgi:hypothetical protein
MRLLPPREDDEPEQEVHFNRYGRFGHFGSFSPMVIGYYAAYVMSYHLSSMSMCCATG